MSQTLNPSVSSSDEALQFELSPTDLLILGKALIFYAESSRDPAASNEMRAQMKDCAAVTRKFLNLTRYENERSH